MLNKFSQTELTEPFDYRENLIHSDLPNDLFDESTDKTSDYGLNENFEGVDMLSLSPKKYVDESTNVRFINAKCIEMSTNVIIKDNKMPFQVDIFSNTDHVKSNEIAFMSNVNSLCDNKDSKIQIESLNTNEVIDNQEIQDCCSTNSFNVLDYEELLENYLPESSEESSSAIGENYSDKDLCKIKKNSISSKIKKNKKKIQKKIQIKKKVLRKNNKSKQNRRPKRDTGNIKKKVSNKPRKSSKSKTQTAISETFLALESVLNETNTPVENEIIKLQPSLGYELRINDQNLSDTSQNQLSDQNSLGTTSGNTDSEDTCSTKDGQLDHNSQNNSQNKKEKESNYSMRNVLHMESCWEVANQVGGIHTVLKTKARQAFENFYNYCLIGPLFPDKDYNGEVKFYDDDQIANMEYIENRNTFNTLEQHKEVNWVKDAIDILKSRQIRARCGRWLIEGQPLVILVAYADLACKIDEIKYSFWQSTGISMDKEDISVHDALMFGWAAGQFVTEVAGSLRKIDTEFEAKKRQIFEKHCIEKAAAHLAHVFTTISAITAKECAHFLQRQPDLITPNGINYITSENEKEKNDSRIVARESVVGFVDSYFAGEDLSSGNLKIGVISGRYEYRNKGVDILIESLARLNHDLKEKQSTTTLVVFFVLPAPNNGYNPKILEQLLSSYNYSNSISSLVAKAGKKASRSMNTIVTNENNEECNLLSQEEKIELHRLKHMQTKNHCGSPIVTHILKDDQHDQILTDLRRCKLFNAPEDRVKVVFHADFVRKDNLLLNLDYNDLIKGADFGIFPSYYEPFGYTPAEFAREGKPSITSSLAGFGDLITNIVPGKPENSGIGVINRHSCSLEDSVQELQRTIKNFIEIDGSISKSMSSKLDSICRTLDWKEMISFYSIASKLSLYRTDIITFNMFADIAQKTSEQLNNHYFKQLSHRYTQHVNRCNKQNASDSSDDSTTENAPDGSKSYKKSKSKSKKKSSSKSKSSSESNKTLSLESGQKKVSRAKPKNTQIRSRFEPKKIRCRNGAVINPNGTIIWPSSDSDSGNNKKEHCLHTNNEYNRRKKSNNSQRHAKSSNNSYLV
ncbi:MAG: glycogen synthase isoform 1 [Paramarteilia canceri]